MPESFLVVGAGTAGCVVASRLSEDPGRAVTLIEAGPDYVTAGNWPADVLDSTVKAESHDWGYTGRADETGTVVAVPRGKLTGGSSSVNYCVALRSRPSDHAVWPAGWSWDDVLPCYRALENDPDGLDPWHGRTGPVPVRRYDRGQLSPSQEAFFQACRGCGFEMVEDHNAPDSMGIGMTPLTQASGQRHNTAQDYLARAVRRPNLRLVADTEVSSVEFKDQRGIGVRLSDGRLIAADHVILCAGTYGTPAILMRSGVGPAAQSRELGIPVAADLPGVGENLGEHPGFYVTYAARPQPHAGVPRFRTALTLRSSPGEPDIDLHIHGRTIVPVTTRVPHPTGFDFVMFACLVQPTSRGSIRLRSREPSAPPLIDLGLLRTPEDVRRLSAGVRVARRVARCAPLRDLLVAELSPGEHDLETAIRARPAIYHHPVGTCRMGPGGDPAAVVDHRCRVRGLDRVWVIDASVMPVPPRATTALPTIMLAERAIALNWPAGNLLTTDALEDQRAGGRGFVPDVDRAGQFGSGGV